MNPSNKTLLTLLLLIVLAVVGYSVLTLPDNRTTGQRVGDAIDALPRGTDKAAQQLEKRTPGQKLGDKIKDATAGNQ
jgi:hypothetical protein